MQKRLMRVLYVPICAERCWALVERAASSDVVTLSSLVFIKVSRQGHPNGTNHVVIKGVWRLIFSSPLSFPFFLLGFHIYSLQNSKGSCHFIFISNLIIIFFIAILRIFLIDIFFQYQPSSLDWLRIEFHDFFWFAFYGEI